MKLTTKHRLAVAGITAAATLGIVRYDMNTGHALGTKAIVGCKNNTTPACDTARKAYDDFKKTSRILKGAALGVLALGAGGFVMLGRREEKQPRPQ